MSFGIYSNLSASFNDETQPKPLFTTLLHDSGNQLNPTAASHDKSQADLYQSKIDEYEEIKEESKSKSSRAISVREKRVTEDSDLTVIKVKMTEEEEKEYEKDYLEEVDKMNTLLELFYQEDYLTVDDLLKSNQKYVQKFKEKHHKRKEPLDLDLACAYNVLRGIEDMDDVNIDKEVTTRLNSIKPEETDPDEHNADCLRLFYLLNANFEIQRERYERARNMLTQCLDVPQKLFGKKEEDYLDFYATYMGRIYMKEMSFKDAERCFKDALALRCRYGNLRLVSSSYNDLALVYMEEARNTTITEIANGYSYMSREYLDKAIECDREFMEKVDNGDKDAKLHLGKVDYRRPDVKRTEKEFKELFKGYSECDIMLYRYR